MGGANSGIKNNTTCVMFESATFARGNVRKTSRRLGLRSDSSARFEKGIETYTNNVGLSRALHLVQQLDCGKVTKGRDMHRTAGGKQNRRLCQRQNTPSVRHCHSR